MVDAQSPSVIPIEGPTCLLFYYFYTDVRGPLIIDGQLGSTLFIIWMESMESRDAWDGVWYST